MKHPMIKTAVLLLLILTLFNCNKDDENNSSSNQNYFISAKVTRNGETFDYKSTSGVMIIKAVSSGFEIESVANNGSNGYTIAISFSRQTELDGEPLPDNNISFSISTEENDEDLNWMTSALFFHDGNQNPNGNFTITSETDTYMEGTFNFNASLATQTQIDVNNRVEVTNGAFKLRKLNY